jgi:hypothetical protein
MSLLIKETMYLEMLVKDLFEAFKLELKFSLLTEPGSLLNTPRSKLYLLLVVSSSEKT